MARTKKKFDRREIAISPERAALIKRVCFHGIIACLFFGSLAAAFYYTKQYVEREVVMATEPATIVIKNKPRWMSDFLVRRIAATARPAGLHSAFDRQVLVRTRKALQANPWVEKVYDVRRAFGEKPGDTIEIDCEYRTPVALVKWGACYWLVDRNGYKLPEQYEPRDVPKIVTVNDGIVDIRIIDGVRRPPPETGKKWSGEDVAAGLEMIALLADKPYAQDILKVNVAHFGNAREPHVVLITKFGTEIRWGRTPSESDKDPFIEVSAATKLDYLKKIYSQYGRVDGGQPGGIDIRFDRVTYPSAEPAGAIRTAAGGE
ncbi:MAG TPA: hypothetical protein VG326_03875 [Tepidisphaeraceae bacterium]|jgi:hypothetical protein|nr:hypothetical protein [Tepidisphaeraceae bacterium]